MPTPPDNAPKAGPPPVPPGVRQGGPPRVAPIAKGPPPPPPAPPIRAAAPPKPPSAAPAVPEPQASATPGPHARVIMVVEDDASIRDMLVRALGTTYTVYEAPDGQTALEMLSRLKPPDLMIMDVMMPRMDGLTLAGKLKAEARFKSVPLIFLTGRDSPKDVVQGINVGARHYLTKPFKIQTLLEKVGKAVGEKK